MNMLASRLILPCLIENVKISAWVLHCTVKNYDCHLFFFKSYDTETSLIWFSTASALISLHTRNLFHASACSGFGCQEIKENPSPVQIKETSSNDNYCIAFTTCIHIEKTVGCAMS